MSRWPKWGRHMQIWLPARLLDQRCECARARDVTSTTKVGHTEAVRRAGVMQMPSVGIGSRLRWAVALAAGIATSLVVPIATPAGAIGNGWSVVSSPNSSPSQLNELFHV